MTKRFVPGQRLARLPGNSLNQLFDMLEKVGSLGPPPGSGDQRRPADTPILVVPVVNNTGSDLVERAIAGVDTSAFTPPEIAEGSDPPNDDDNQADVAILSGAPVELITPDASTHASRWVVTLGPIASEGTGWAAVTGLVWCRVNITDNSHQFVQPSTGDTIYARSANSGAPIWSHAREDESDKTGKQWALVLLGGGGGSTIRHARVTTAITGATTAAIAGWGAGEVVLTDLTTGVPTGDPIAVVNEWTKEFGVDYPIKVDTSYSPPHVLGGECEAQDAVTFWGDEEL